MDCLSTLSRNHHANRDELGPASAARRTSVDAVDCLHGGIMCCNLIRAAVWAGLFLSAGTAPVFANALDLQLQPVATPIPRETVSFDGREAPGTIIIRTSERRLYLVLPDHQALRYGVGVGIPWIYLGWRHPYRVQARMAGLDAAGADVEASARPPPAYAGGHRQSARRARHVSRRHAVSNSRLQRARHDRAGGFVRLHTDDEPGRHRPVRAGKGRRAGRRDALNRRGRGQRPPTLGGRAALVFPGACFGRLSVKRLPHEFHGID